MTYPSKLHALTALSLACAMLAGCGGGDAEAPPPPASNAPAAPPAAAPDTTAPTVTVADNISTATASGPVTFTFVFSEDVGISFAADDIVVTGGTAGTFTRVSGSQATFVLTPTANATGTMGVSVAAGKFTDLQGNSNTATGSGQQAYDTLVPAVPGNTGTCLAANCVDFSAAGITFGPFENQAGGSVAIVNDPINAANKVVKFVMKPGDGDYFGTTIGGFSAPVVLTSTNKTVTLRVWTPTAGTNFLLKFEGGTGGPAATEKDVVTTKAGEWETLTFVMPDVGTYTTVVLFPNGRSSVSADKTMYVDELKFPAAAAGGGGACAAPNCVDFSAAGIGFGPFENQAGGTVAIGNDPTNAANKVVAFVKKPGDGDYFGTTITGLGVSPVLTAGSKTVTMRVYTPAAGTNFLLKFEGGTGGPATTEKDAVTTLANAWETLTFVMPDVGTFSTVVVFPNGRSGVTANKAMYIDDLTFPATASAGGGGGGGGGGSTAFTGGIYAADYTGSLANNTAASTLGGSVGFFYDQRLFDTKIFQDGGVVGSAQDPAGVHNFYFGFGKPAAPVLTDAYFGGFVGAPGNTTADASAYAKVKLKFWGDAETWEKSNFTPMPEVILQGPLNAACSNPSGRPEISRTVTGQKIGAGSEYIILKTEFALKASCGGAYTVNSVWASVAAIVVQLTGTSLQYVNTVPSTPPAYPTFINIGPISFIN
jgi:hypothetical protein